jgi:hypothetical protein
VLAAYLADKYMLGQSRSGWKLVNAARRRHEVSAGYVKKLKRFLAKTGYR